MPLVEKRIYRISDDLSALNAQQIGVQSSNDADLGYKLYGGKDDAGVLSYWPAKDKAARFSTLGLIGGSTTGESGILRHDTDGNVTGGQITIEDLNDLIDDGEVGLWQRDGVDNVLSPATVGDRIKVGAGTVAVPGVAIGDSNTGGYFDLTTSRLCLAMDGAPSWQFELADTDVHRILVGDDQTSPNQRYFHIKWEEDDYENRSVALIENYRGSGAPGADGTFTISNNVQDGTFGTMTVKNFHTNNSTLNLWANGSAGTKVDIQSTGAVSEIKNTASKITLYGQVQANPADSAAAPDYSFVGHTGAGMRYETSDDSLRFGLNSVDMLRLYDVAGMDCSLYTLGERRYFGIYHERTTGGSSSPDFTIQSWGHDSASGAVLNLYAKSDNDAGTPTRVYIKSEGGYADTLIDAVSHGATRTANTRLYALAEDNNATSSLHARSNSNTAGHTATVNIFTQHQGTDPTNDHSVYIYNNNLGNGQGYVYVGTNLSAYSDYLYLADSNHQSAAPAWTLPGVPLSDAASDWDNYKSTYGEVGILAAMVSAGGAPALTAGYVGYGSATNQLTGKASFFFDATNNYLGIGHATPDCGLHVGANNPTYSSGGSDAFITGDLEVTNIDLINTIRGHGFTAGSIPYFSGSPPALTQDISNLYFKDTGFKIATSNASGAATSQLATTSSGGDCDISFRAYGGANDDTSVVIAGTTSGTGITEITISADGGGAGSFLLLDTPPGNSSIRIDTDIGFEDNNRVGSTWGSARMDFSASSAEWSSMETLIGSEGSLFGGILAAAEVLVDEGSGETANSTSSSSYQQRIRVTTPALTSGVKYLILWSCELQAQADCEVQGRVQLNDTTTIAEPYYDNDPYATRGTCQSGIYYSDSLSGVQNIDLDWRKAYDPGSGALVYCGRARIVVLRVGL